MPISREMKTTYYFNVVVCSIPLRVGIACFVMRFDDDYY